MSLKSALPALTWLSIAYFLLLGAVLGLLFDAYNNRYGVVYTTTDQYRIAVGSSHYSNTSIVTGKVVFDLSVADSGANFTMPSVYQLVANYNLALGIILAALTVGGLLLVAFLSMMDAGKEVLAVMYCVIMLVEACVSFPLLIVLVHACHELTQNAVSWQYEQGGKQIFAAVSVVLVEVLIVAAVIGYHVRRGKDSAAEPDAV